MHEAGFGWMGMRIDEARSDRFSAEVNLADVGASKIQHIGIAAHGEKSATRNCHGLRARLPVIHGQDIAVVKNQLRLFLFEREHRQCSKRAKKIAARWSGRHVRPLRNCKNAAHATPPAAQRQLAESLRITLEGSRLRRKLEQRGKFRRATE